MKKLLLLMSFCLASCTLISLPIAVVETTASVAKIPITIVGSVADAVNDDDADEEKE